MQKDKLNLLPGDFAGTQTTFPSFSKPEPVGYFSLTQDREYRDTLENLKYIPRKYLEGEQTVNFDLNKDYEQRQPKPAGDEKLDQILRFILTQKNSSAQTRPVDVDIVCFRGLLRLLMCTPFDWNEWIILATKFKDTIYLCAHETEQKKFENANMTEQNKKFCSYGFKFEDYMLSANPNGESSDAPTKEGEEFCVMYQSKLADIKLMYGAEMDGVNADEPVNDLEELKKAKFIELKVKQREQSYNQRRNSARFKHIKWWCQSFLVGITDIVVGYRTRDGICTSTEPVKVSQIPKDALQIDPKLWRPVDCMNFLSNFLENVQKLMENNEDLDVVLFEYSPNKDPFINFTKYSGKNKYSFLPEWFIKTLDSNFKKKN